MSKANMLQTWCFSRQSIDISVYVIIEIWFAYKVHRLRVTLILPLRTYNGVNHNCGDVFLDICHPAIYHWRLPGSYLNDQSKKIYNALTFRENTLPVVLKSCRQKAVLENSKVKQLYSFPGGSVTNTTVLLEFIRWFYLISKHVTCFCTIYSKYL